MADVKIIANYLPQYHRMPENDKWWGEGFTDWVAVKKAEPQFEGHDQPRVPAGEYYYSLDNPDDIARQVALANEYGIYGFGIYHYWFSSKQHFMETPANIFLNNKDLNTHFMFIWDNTSWIRSWSAVKGNNWAPSFEGEKKQGPEILAELKYGGKDEWKKHFEWLLPFFRDERYIKIDGKPVFSFMRMNADPEIITEMAKYWDELGREAGFPGVCCMSKCTWKGVGLDYRFYYEPFQFNDIHELLRKGLEEVYIRKFKKKPGLRIADYDKEWKSILYSARHCSRKNTFYSGIVGFDDTPRRGKKARIIKGQTPEKFEEYLYQLLKISSDQGREMLFVTAWNEWSEGAYLEPDTVNGTAYLEAVKRASERLKNG